MEGRANKAKLIAVHAAALGIVLALLAALARHNFILFHSLSEMVSVGVAWGVFFVVWNARRFAANGFFLSIGVAYLFVAAIDIVHSLSYRGMGVVHDGGNMATQLWIAARYIEAIMLVASFLFLRRPVSAWALLGGLGVLTAAVFASVSVVPVFPTSYVPGSGLTPFKIVSEYIIIGLFALAAALLFVNRGRFESAVWQCLVGSFLLRILSEFAFTAYAGVYDDANMVGHLLKVAGFYLLYRATIPVVLNRPYEALFHDLGQARDALRFTEERFRLAIRPAPVVAFSQDRDLRYDWVFAGDGIRGRVPRPGETEDAFASPADAAVLTGIKRQVLETGQGVRREIRLGRRGRWFELTVVPLRGPDHRITGIVGIAIDVTALITARAEAERAAQAKARFLAAASHDLRQPFQAMRLFHHMLSERQTDSSSRGIAAKLDEAMSAGENLLRALLDVSTLDAGVLTPRLGDFPVMSVLDQVVAEMVPQAEAKGLRLRRADCSAVVTSDPTLLARMVRNLAVNALRYTETGGILIGCRRAGGFVRIVVCDTGIGIAADQLDAIFDDFYQVGNAERDREKGLGLGLSVVSRAGRLLGHRVTVNSAVGRGSSFCIDVPRAGEMAEREPQHAVRER